MAVQGGSTWHTRVVFLKIYIYNMRNQNAKMMARFQVGIAVFDDEECHNAREIK